MESLPQIIVNNSVKTFLTVSFLFCVTILTPAVLIGLTIVYERLGIYHYLESEAKDNDGVNDSGGEPFWEKVILVTGFNAAAVMLTLVFFVPFKFGQFGFKISSVGIFIIAITTTIFHGSTRFAAFVDFGYVDDDSDEHVKRIRDRLFGFGFSFLTSTYLIGIFSAGVGFATGSLGPGLDYGNGNVNLLTTIPLVAFTLFSIIFVAWLSEYGLKSWDIQDCLKSEKID
ncbi:hypothetical protein GOC74_08640 [Halomicrobium mukohataei]|uniref:Uncharacterized protein n=1 Tax=Halomicrobium mukohataei TaxID=57705 RepID=A0A847UC14_9EURY|nr:hypothetical protein [Halomicrobium mukohataei]NLV09996.1 hypothetical protein [Halomicrobium mukohataei]